MNEFWINSNNIKLWAILFLRIYNFKYWKQMNFKIYKIGVWHLFKIMPILPDTTPIACKICHLLDSLKNPLPSIFLSIEHLRTPPTTEVSSTIKWSEAHCKEKRKKKKVFLLCLIIYECILIFFITWHYICCNTLYYSLKEGQSKVYKNQNSIHTSRICW